MAGMNPRPATPTPFALLSKVWSCPNFGGQACCPVSGQTPAEESVNALTHGVGYRFIGPTPKTQENIAHNQSFERAAGGVL